MNKALPSIAESVRELQVLLREEKDVVRKDRLQLIYSIKTGLVRTRLEAASLLGKNRNTIGRWLAVYEREGLEALLSIQSPVEKNHGSNRSPSSKADDRVGRPRGYEKT